MTDRELMQQALEALESKYIVNCGAWRVQQDQVITALRQAIALQTLTDIHQEIEQAQEPEQLAKLGWQQIDCPICGGGARAFPKTEQAQPVAYIRVSKTGNVMACAKSEDFYKLPDQTLLYTFSHPRKPLTDEVLEKMAEACVTDCYFDTLKYARAIEAAHGIKEES